MNHTSIEAIMGGVVLLVAGFFVAFSGQIIEFNSTEGYELQAMFNEATGISAGQDVRISGVKVGSIVDMELDPKTYQAAVTLLVDSDIEVPVDTVAKIASESLLGGKYLSLIPGGDIRMLQDGERISYTESAISLEDMIGRFIFSGEGEEETNAPSASSDTPSPAAFEPEPVGYDDF